MIPNTKPTWDTKKKMVVCSMFLPVFSASILTFVGIDEVLVDMTACGSPVFSWEKMSTCLA